MTCSPILAYAPCLQSPINPSDVNTVQGKYPLQPPLPGAIPGHEGVAEVQAVGPEVGQLGWWMAECQQLQGPRPWTFKLHKLPSWLTRSFAR